MLSLENEACELDEELLSDNSLLWEASLLDDDGLPELDDEDSLVCAPEWLLLDELCPCGELLLEEL